MRKFSLTILAAVLAATPTLAAAQFFPRAAAPAPRAVANRPSNGDNTVTTNSRKWIAEVARNELSRINFLPVSRAENAVQQQAITNFAPNTSFSLGYGREYTADDCVAAIRSAEMRYNLPPYMLHAVALTESGRDGRPSPVAMNIGGKSYFARNTADMVQVVEGRGIRSSIDVGCMQINLKYHGAKFKDWKSLLNPQHNAEYAALYLSQLYRELGSWTRAIGAYHSRTPWRSANYACLVSRRWGQIFGSRRSGCGPEIESMVRLMYSQKQTLWASN